MGGRGTQTGGCGEEKQKAEEDRKELAVGSIFKHSRRGGCVKKLIRRRSGHKSNENIKLFRVNTSGVYKNLSLWTFGKQSIDLMHVRSI